MGLFSRLKQTIQNRSPSQARIEMVTEQGEGFYEWNGKIFHSDIVRACLRPYVSAVGKLVGKHVRETMTEKGAQIAVNPEPYIRFLLEEPNPYMSGQKLQEKLAAQLKLNRNAFALIIRNLDGLPAEIYPIPASSAETDYSNPNGLQLKFTMKNGKQFTFPYSDIIHLRLDFYDKDIFGTPLAPALTPLMEIVYTIDQGIVKAIKNSNVIRWLLKFVTSTRPEDIVAKTKEFADAFQSLDHGVGVAGVDSKADAIQLQPTDFVPNAAQMDRTVQRIYALLGTNPKIVQSDYSEDEWISYFEAEIEPVSLDLKNEYSRKLFTRRERSYGNQIVFDAFNLQCASMGTKLGLMQMVDRGAMTPNEWRRVLNLAPLPGGDQPIRRLDTQAVIPSGANKQEGGEDDEGEDDEGEDQRGNRGQR